ncbi:MAG: LamB/YcsF family protein [Candidatus Dormibacteraceae bacterium]
MLNLNCDLGEGAGDDELILALVDSASVCCGAHAGSAGLAVATACRCRELGVEVGAHPGYPDRAGRGREEIGLSIAEVESLLRAQVGLLAGAGPISYVKPHGALYHRCQEDPEAAAVLARVASEWGLGLIGQPGSEIIGAARRAGLAAYREGFADRGYTEHRGLVPRSEPGALLGPGGAALQAVRLARSGALDTICLHGDSPGAAEVARAVRRALDGAGVVTGPLRPGARGAGSHI